MQTLITSIKTLIVDTNIVISALISPNQGIASILKNKSYLKFIAPIYLEKEVFIHWNKVLQYTKLNEIELFEEWMFYKKNIEFIEGKEISDDIKLKAYTMVKDIDIKDQPFIATHLATGFPIWSSDKKLVNQLRAKGFRNIFITTEELKLYLSQLRETKL